MVPVLMISGINGLWNYRREQAELRTRAVADARRLSEAVDRELSADIDAAAALAALPQLDGLHDVSGFEEVARRAQARHPLWLAVLLLDPEGRRLTDSRSPKRLGSTIDLASVQPVVTGGRPLIGNIGRGPEHFGIPVRAPVVRNGRVIAIVTVVIRPEGVGELLTASRLPASWVGTVIDASGRVVARTQYTQAFLGRRASAAALAARSSALGGTYDGLTLEKIATISAFWKSPVYGWSVHVGIPRAGFEAPLRRSIAFTAAGFAASLLLTVIFLALAARELSLRRREAAAAEQSNRLEALGRLTGGVAHDFNNLLTIIQGNAEILQRRLTSPDAERPLAAIREATGRAGRLTRELLVFARGGQAETVVVDLNATLRGFLGSVQEAVGPTIEVESALDPGAGAVDVDRVQLELAVLNLAINARDAMPAGGVITISTQRASEELVQLAVADTGTGIPEDIRDQVFEPFFTTKPAGSGTGLGLTQVYGFARHAGGLVELISRTGKGTTVVLRLPVSRVVPAVAAPAPPRPAADSLAHLKILLLDDNPQVREVGAAYLREQGAEVVEGSSAAEGTSALDQGDIDVLVSDIVMPGEANGLELAERARLRCPRLPILLVSGYSSSLAEALERGFKVLRKPYALDDLGGAVAELTAPPRPEHERTA